MNDTNQPEELIDSTPMLDESHLNQESEVHEQTDQEPHVEAEAGQTVAEEPDRNEDIQKEDKGGRVQHHCIQTHPHTLGGSLANGDMIITPPDLLENISVDMQNLPNINLVDNRESARWAAVLQEGLSLCTYGSTFSQSFAREGSSWKQTIIFGGATYGAGFPRISAPENQKLVGVHAVSRMMSHRKIGAQFQVPLWHSGFWVTFSPPMEDDYIDLHRQIMSDKIQMGRYTYGSIYSNLTVYTLDRLLKSALQHVYDTTLKDVAIEDLFKVMSCQDIFTFLWGYACAMYPRGVTHERSCVANPGKCNHTTTEVLNLTKLQWTDETTLSDRARTHMSSRQPRSRTRESLNMYQQEITQLQKKSIKINEGTDEEITVNLKSPSAFDHIESGHRWIGDIVQTINQALSVDATDDERNDVVIRRSRSTVLRQYAHWIESIEVGSNVIEDQDSIEKTLDVLSSDSEVREEVTLGVVKYIDDSSISVIGIPVYDCPKCHSPQETKLEKEFINVIPLDVIQLFFTLVSRRLEKVNLR